jgi:hypothetical protein
MNRKLLTIWTIVASLAVLAGAGAASAAEDPVPGPSRPSVNQRLMQWPDLEIAPYLLNTTNVVILNNGSVSSTASVLKWSLTKEVVNSCWCLGWGSVDVPPVQPGGYSAVDMCAEFKEKTSWLDDGFVSTHLDFEIAQTVGSELFLDNNYRTLDITCTA